MKQPRVVAVAASLVGIVVWGFLLSACRGKSDRSKQSSCKPSVEQVIPAVGDAAGGERVTIVTSCFRDDFTLMTPQVFFGSSVATGVIGVSATTLSVTTPAHPVEEAVNVEVRSTGIAQAARLTGGFTYFLNPPPAACSVVRVVPDWGVRSVPRTVLVEGSGFPVAPDPAPIVEFGRGNLGTSVTQIGPSMIQVDTPTVATSGAVDVIVTPAGGRSCVGPDLYTFVDPPAGCTLVSVDPDFGPESGGSIITLQGDGFAPFSEVRFGGSLASSMVKDPTTILVNAPPGVGTAGIVVDLGGGITCDLPGAYRYVSCGGAACGISATVPSVGRVGEPVTIFGTSFEAGALVLFGEAPARVISETPPNQIVAEAPAPVGGNTVVDVQVVNPNGGCCEKAGGYTYNPCMIDTVVPVTGGSVGGDLVTITGMGFDPVVDVYFGQSLVDPATIMVDGTGTRITLLSPAENSEGLRTVEVQNRLSGTSCLACCGFAYFQMTPDRTCMITLVTPSSGPLSGGNAVRISGAGFESVGTCVYFGANCATINSVQSDSITVTAPPGSGPGSVDITVAHPDVSPCIFSNAYTYN